MARVTVEDCILKVPNRFELVVLAAQRARQISTGAPLTLDRDNDKNPVLALREIAEGTVETDNLRNNVTSHYRQNPEIEPEEEEFADLLAQEGAFVSRETIIPDSMHEEAEDSEEAEETEASDKDLDSDDE